MIKGNKMKNNVKSVLGVIVILLISAGAIAGENWRSLFNGKNLEGWDTYLGPKYSAEEGEFVGDPIGFNTDPDKVFTVVQADGKPALRISGEHFGGISTKESFEDYHLKLQFKWGEDKYAPRADIKRDSGLLYHASGEQGAELLFWMKSLEMQIQEGDCGDYWGLGPIADIAAIKKEGNEDYQYVKGAPLVAFHNDLGTGRHVIKAGEGHSEKPHGEWNTLEVYTVDGNSVHIVNGVVKMVLNNTRSMVDGKEVVLQSGKIQLQTEGAEVFYRDIKIKNIDAIPDKLL